MSHRNRTYVIFDGDNDMWAYAYMKGWRNSERVDFDFADAHDLRPMTSRASNESYIKLRLAERLRQTNQVVVLVGSQTRYLYLFVRWEIETAQTLDLPIIVANLNHKRALDVERCPPILRDHYAVHVDFRAAILRYALDLFPAEYARREHQTGPRHYDDSVYQRLGLA